MNSQGSASGLTDAELVARGIDGDPQGLAAIYTRYADRLYDYALSIVGNHPDAGDAVHDGYLVASQRLLQLRDPDKLRPWLYAITRSAALAILRHRKRDVVSDPAAFVLAVDLRTSDTPVGSMDARSLVAQAIAGLDEDDRELLNLQLRHDLEGAALAEIIGESVNNVNVASHRMRRRLEQSMSAVVLMNTPGYECSGLTEVVDEALSPLVRKRAARHIERCERCAQQKEYATSAAALFSSLPFVVAPESLHSRIDRVAEVSGSFASSDVVESDDVEGLSKGPKRPGHSYEKVLIGVAGVIGIFTLLGLALRTIDDPVAFNGQRILGGETTVSVAGVEPSAGEDPASPIVRDGESLAPDLSIDVSETSSTEPTGGSGPSTSQTTSTPPSDSTTSSSSTVPLEPPQVEVLASPCNPISVTVRITSESRITSQEMVLTEVDDGPSNVSRFTLRREESEFIDDWWSATAGDLNGFVYERSVRVTNAGGTTTVPLVPCRL